MPVSGAFFLGRSAPINGRSANLKRSTFNLQLLNHPTGHRSEACLGNRLFSRQATVSSLVQQSAKA